MALDAVFTLKLDAELRDDFMAEAAEARRPASQVVREMMREYVEDQRRARAYEAFLAEKVAAARASIGAGEGVDNDEVRAIFAARRAAVR
ncbi:MAG: antitoxin of toxin-antitoxin stability system [Propionibacterium sp.]|nr:antitoxin of toxin-antitoxin stability system [Propionibacterium sp.]